MVNHRRSSVSPTAETNSVDKTKSLGRPRADQPTKTKKVTKKKSIKKKKVEQEEDYDSFIDNNDDTCLMCGHGGILICCAECSRTIHKECLGEKVTKKDWICDYCNKIVFHPKAEAIKKYNLLPLLFDPIQLNDEPLNTFQDDTHSKASQPNVTSRIVQTETLSLLNRAIDTLMNGSVIPPDHSFAFTGSKLQSMRRFFQVAHNANLDVREAFVHGDSDSALRNILFALDRSRIEYFLPRIEESISKHALRLHQIGFTPLRNAWDRNRATECSKYVMSKFEEYLERVRSNHLQEELDKGGFDLIRSRGHLRFDLSIPNLTSVFPELKSRETWFFKLAEEVLMTAQDIDEPSDVEFDSSSSSSCEEEEETDNRFNNNIKMILKKKEKDRSNAAEVDEDKSSEKENRNPEMESQANEAKMKDNTSPILSKQQKSFNKQKKKSPRSLTSCQVRLVHVGCMLTFPGSQDQPLHSDGPHRCLSSHKGVHALNVFLPLVDVTAASGPTEFLPRSHLLWRHLCRSRESWRDMGVHDNFGLSSKNVDRVSVLQEENRLQLESEEGGDARLKNLKRGERLCTRNCMESTYIEPDEDLTGVNAQAPTSKAGDAIIFDYRITHRGLANKTQESVRPVLYLTFARKGDWVDEKNFSERRYPLLPGVRGKARPEETDIHVKSRERMDKEKIVRDGRKEQRKRQAENSSKLFKKRGQIDDQQRSNSETTTNNWKQSTNIKLKPRNFGSEQKLSVKENEHISTANKEETTCPGADLASVIDDEHNNAKETKKRRSKIGDDIAFLRENLPKKRTTEVFMREDWQQSENLIESMKKRKKAASKSGDA